MVFRTVGFLENEGHKHICREIVYFKRFQKFEMFGTQVFEIKNTLVNLIVINNYCVQMRDTDAHCIRRISGRGGVNGVICL